MSDSLNSSIPPDCPRCGDYVQACTCDDRADAECPDCHGEGGVILCIDDLCYRRETCIHGDAPTMCSTCKGTGRVEADSDGDVIDAPPVTPAPQVEHEDGGRK